VAALPVAALALAGGAWSASASTRGAGGAAAAVMVGARSASTNRDAARTDAAALLSRLRLPPGAIKVTSNPPGAGAALAHAFDAPATPNLVDEHGWWVVPMTPASLLAFVERQRPRGSRLEQSGFGSKGPQMVGYGWPARLGVLSTRWLVIEVVALANGSTALRVDAQVVWITPRPASERIPAGVDRLTVSVVRARRSIQGPVTVTARNRIRRARSLVDGLPLAQPGVSACPVDLGITVRLTFYGRSNRPLAVAGVDPGGCQNVSLTIRGRGQGLLTSAAFPGSGRPVRVSLVAQLDAALRLKLTTAP
jgi:hypothetical protein